MGGGDVQSFSKVVGTLVVLGDQEPYVNLIYIIYIEILYINPNTLKVFVVQQNRSFVL